MVVPASLNRWLLALLVGAAPLPLGSNRPLFWAANALLAAAILTMAAGDTRDFRDERASRAAALCGFGFMAIGGFMALQAAMLLPPGVHHFVWRDAGVEGGAISINPSSTWTTLCWWLTLAVMVPAIRLGTDPERAESLIRTMAVGAAAIALFGILSELLSWDSAGLVAKEAYRGWLTGTFVNRNHAATFFALGSLASLSLAARSEAMSPGGTAKEPRPARPLCWLLIAGFLMTSVYLTGSRGGILSGAAGALVLFALWLRHQKQAGLITGVFVGAMGATVAASYLLNVGVVDRADTETSDLGRWQMYRGAIRAILDRPILGHGAGTYPDVQPLYQVPGMDSNVLWTHAHSVYLEMAATIGVPATVCGFMIVAALAAKLLFAALRARTPSPPLLLAVSSVVTVSIHSLVDFSLQIQAIAIWFAVILGLGIGQVVAASTPRDKPRAPSSWPRIERWTLASIAGLACVMGVRTGAIEAAVPRSMWLQENRALYTAGAIPGFTLYAARALAGKISDRDLSVAELSLCHAELNQAVEGADRRASTRALRRCLAAVDAGLRASPGSPALWAKRSEILFGLGGATPDFTDALAKSYRFGPLHGPAMSIRLPTSLISWTELNGVFREQIERDLAYAPQAAIATLARHYVSNRPRQEAIRTALSEVAPEVFVLQFEDALRTRSDHVRRAADRMRMAGGPECREETAHPGPVQISAVGMSFDGPPLMRVWINGRAVADLSVDSGENATTFRIPLPPEAAAQSVEIEFWNDHWEGENRDRNVGIASFSIGGTAVPLSKLVVPEFNAPVALAQSGVRWMIRNGSLRYQAECLSAP